MQNNSFVGRLGAGISHKMGSMLKNPYSKVNINWFSEKRFKHLPAGEIRSHTLFGHKIYFYSPQEFLYGLKEIFIKEPYKQELPTKPYILDCGANIGMSVIYMKQLYPDAEIVAFEPDEINFDLLTKNVDSFNLKGVTLKKEAVWKEKAILKFSNESTMGSKITADPSGATRDVQAIRLKDYLNRPIDFLKMDIEGAEYEVVMDLADQLHQVKNFFLEYHGTYAQQKELLALFNLLTQQGFVYYIKEAADLYDHPLTNHKDWASSYDVQLNIFCRRL